MRSPPLRGVQALAILGAIIVGVVIRLDGFPRPIWFDEAYVANTVLADSVGAMLHPELWPQTSAPLLLLLTRASIRLFGLSEVTFRIFPLLLGCLTPVLAWLLARRVLSPAFQVSYVTLLAANLLLIRQSQEFKPYAVDAAVAGILMLLMWRYVDKPVSGRFWALLLVSAAALTLSYPAIIYCATAAVLLSTSPPFGAEANKPAGRLTRTMVYLLVIGLVGGLLYLLQIQPNQPPSLKYYWATKIPNLSHPATLPGFYWNGIQGLLGWLPRVEAFKQAFYVGYAAVTVLGLLATCFAPRRSHSVTRYLLAAGAVPLAVWVGLSLMQAYPFDSGRLSAFVLPSFFLLVLAGMESVWLILRDWFLAPRRIAAAEVTILLLAVAGATLYLKGSVADRWTGAREDMRSAVSTMRDRSRPDDLVYLHPSVAEQGKLYFKMLNWRPRHLVIGAGYWPCCPIEFVRHSPGKDALMADFLANARLADSGRIWYAYTTRWEHWYYAGLDEPAVLLASLPSIGCREEEKMKYPGISLSLITCEASESAPAP